MVREHEVVERLGTNFLKCVLSQNQLIPALARRQCFLPDL